VPARRLHGVSMMNAPIGPSSALPKAKFIPAHNGTNSRRPRRRLGTSPTSVEVGRSSSPFDGLLLFITSSRVEKWSHLRALNVSRVTASFRGLRAIPTLTVLVPALTERREHAGALTRTRASTIHCSGLRPLDAIVRIVVPVVSRLHTAARWDREGHLRLPAHRAVRPAGDPGYWRAAKQQDEVASPHPCHQDCLGRLIIPGRSSAGRAQGAPYQSTNASAPPIFAGSVA